MFIFVHKLHEPMIVSIIKMTGPELKKIFTMSGMTGDDFAKRLGISRGGLYLVFKDKIVSTAIEQKLMDDDELKRFRQLSNPVNGNEVSVRQQESTPMNDVAVLFNKTVDAMQSQQDKFFARLDRMLDKSESDTDHIKMVNEKLLTLMQQGVKR